MTNTGILQVFMTEVKFYDSFKFYDSGTPESIIIYCAIKATFRSITVTEKTRPHNCVSYRQKCIYNQQAVFSNDIK